MNIREIGGLIKKGVRISGAALTITAPVLPVILPPAIVEPYVNPAVTNLQTEGYTVLDPMSPDAASAFEVGEYLTNEQLTQDRIFTRMPDGTTFSARPNFLRLLAVNNQILINDKLGEGNANFRNGIEIVLIESAGLDNNNVAKKYNELVRRDLDEINRLEARGQLTFQEAGYLRGKIGMLAYIEGEPTILSQVAHDFQQFTSDRGQYKERNALWLDKDGRVVRDGNGKILFLNLFTIFTPSPHSLDPLLSARPEKIVLYQLDIIGDIYRQRLLEMSGNKKELAALKDKMRSRGYGDNIWNNLSSDQDCLRIFTQPDKKADVIPAFVLFGKDVTAVATLAAFLTYIIQAALKKPEKVEDL
jgi:hypothetical protein